MKNQERTDTLRFYYFVFVLIITMLLYFETILHASNIIKTIANQGFIKAITIQKKSINLFCIFGILSITSTHALRDIMNKIKNAKK